MIYNQKDIVLLPFPFTSLSGAKKRPALILSKNSFNKSQEDFICCLITTNLEPDQEAVFLEPSDLKDGKLNFASKIKPYRIFTAQQKIIQKRIATLSDPKFKKTIQKIHGIIA